MRRHAIAGIAVAFLLAGFPALAVARSEADAAIASACSTCHATVMPPAGIPPLRGPASRLLADLRAFRDGTRAATIMDRITRGYRDDELVRIAEFIGSTADATTDIAR